MEFGTPVVLLFFFFFFNDTATTEIYTLSLHDALPISPAGPIVAKGASACYARANRRPGQTTGIRICQAMSAGSGDRKSTRLNSSHLVISYAVFCLKKKNRDASPSCGCLRGCRGRCRRR